MRKTLVVLLLLLAAATALAQRKKITLDDLIIEGNIQKPEAFFILPRTNLNFADLERRDTRLRPFARRVLELARSFDEERLIVLLQDCLETPQDAVSH